MVGAYLLVGIVWAWLVLELNVWGDEDGRFAGFGFVAVVVALSWITVVWPLSMFRVARNLLRN